MLHVWNIYQHLPHKWPSFVGKYTIHGAYGLLLLQSLMQQSPQYPARLAGPRARRAEDLSRRHAWRRAIAGAGGAGAAAEAVEHGAFGGGGQVLGKKGGTCECHEVKVEYICWTTEKICLQRWKKIKNIRINMRFAGIYHDLLYM